SVLPLHTERPPHKMLSRGGSIGEATADPNRVWAWVVRSLERLIEELEYHGIQAGKLSVAASYKGGPALSGDGPLRVPCARFALVRGAARDGLRKAWLPGLRVGPLHLIATKLQYRGSVQLGLFEPPVQRAEALARLKREVNARHGRFALRSGMT